MYRAEDPLRRNMFLSKALEKILEEKEVRRSQHLQLKKACESALEEIRADAKNHSDGQSSTLPLPKSTSSSGDSERYFLPFELALQSKNPKFTILSLDCLQKLIAYGHFSGNVVDATNPSRKLIDRLVEVVCDCFNKGKADDAVLLQIVKLLLTIVASSHVELHGASLLLVIKTVFNIHLCSKEKVTQETASGSLVQMINRILARMEEQPDTASKHGEPLRHRSISQITPNGSSSHFEPRSDSPVALGNGEESGDATTREIDPTVSEIMSDLLNAVVTEVNGVAVVSERSSPVPPSPSLRFRQNSLDSRSVISIESEGASDDRLDKRHCTIWERDAYNVFRSMCKLSMKPHSEPADPRSYDYRSKVLSLKLVHSMLQSSGEIFRNHPMFTDAIRVYLCVSLSKNGVSPIPDIFRLSLSIFLELLSKFKIHLKMQIEVFFRDIFLNILESPSTSFVNKWTLMEALSKICSDAQCVVDLYVNYDCDLHMANIFARIIGDLTKIAQSTQFADPTVTPLQAHKMRIKGYQCIVSILHCMVEWSKELYIAPHPLNNLDPERSSSEETDKPLPTNSSSASLTSGSNDQVAFSHSQAVVPQLDSPSQLHEQKMHKEIVEQGIELFNKKPKKGIEFLQDHQIIGSAPSDIATFLHREDRFDKTQVGDFLSENNPLSREIMHAYVDQIHFAGMDIVQALRTFLDGFRLPGEAQKIDRLMEKFASRYCENNPDLGIFASADTAYVLSYSIIMLTTDLHSPQVKHKMTKEQYVKMNRGINDQKDLPEEYLSKIYDEISEREIKMKAVPPSKPKNNAAAAANPKQRKLLHNMEMNQVAQVAKVMMENVSHVQAAFTSAKHCEHVKPMFKICWTHFLAVFSFGLQESDDTELNQLCLEGFRYAIRVACIFHITMERDAYIQALARFTLLTANSPLSEMKAKNVDTIKTLISIAQSDGNYLDHCWLEIMKCVSHLELAQLIGNASKLKTNSVLNLKAGKGSILALTNPAVTDSSSIFDNDLWRGKTEMQRIASLQESIEEARSQSMVVAVDRIFTNSIGLDGEAIVHFVKALCQVSTEELTSTTHPRIFSLQKIVEISYYNMDRIRIQWSRIWAVLGEHFNEVGCKSNEEIACFALDSLRQLSMKFLEKGEFAHFRFQKDFLRPFEHIMKNNRSPVIRDMIVHCMTQMVSTKPGNIKSGWKNIFSVLTHAASDTDADLVELAFKTTTKIIVQYFDEYFTNIIESFQDAIKCLAEFACNINFPDISMEAIRLIRMTANHVAERPEIFREHALDFEDKRESSERVWVRGWFPILLGLSVVVNRCKLDVRTRALTVLFEIMKTFGSSYQPAWWKDLFQILFRLFDDLKLPQNHMEKAEWMTTTCSHALFSIVDVMTQYFEVLEPFLLEDVYGQLKWCITQDNEQLARSGVNCFETLVLSSGGKFSEEVWRKTCYTIGTLMKMTLPTELMELLPKDPSMSNHAFHEEAVEAKRKLVRFADEAFALDRLEDEEFGRKIPTYGISMENPVLSHVMVKCAVQLELIQAVENIVFYPATCRHEDAEYQAVAESGKQPIQQSSSLTAETGMYPFLTGDQLFDIVGSLLEVHNFSKSFNMNEDLRLRLSQTVFRGRRTPPGLLKQEILSLSCVLRIVFRLHCDPRHTHESARAANLLLSLCRETIGYFCSLPSDAYRELWKGVMIMLLVKIIRMEDEKFRRFASVLYHNMCLLMTVVIQPDLKNLVRWFFMRCGDTFHITTELPS